MSKLNRRHFMLGASLTALEATREMGANDRIGVAIVGCGMRGLLGEVLQFSKESNVEVAGVCDIWKQQRETAAQKVKQTGAPDPKLFAHFEDALASPAVDAVLISTPDHQHCTQLSAAIKAKKDVYVEKPLAMNMRELLSAVDAVKRSDRIVQCGTQVRNWAPSVSARAFVSSGGLGKIFKIEQSRNSFRPY
jgi:predicted dehydrogenase